MNSGILLDQIAKEAMIERGLIPDFPPAVVKETEAMHEEIAPSDLRDLRNYFFFSIDNEDSRDLDQLTFAEKNRVWIAIADVNAYVKRGSPTDGYARHNTTSVYTPARIFPMLPLKLSNGLTSLNEGEDRSAMVVEIDVDPDGKIALRDLYPALVRNHAKLAYPHVAEWLEKSVPLQKGSKELHDQLILQDELAQRMLSFRTSHGALSFETVELTAIMDEGIAIGLSERATNRALQLIENFMIAGNVAVTKFFMEKRLPIVRRIVRTPKRWDRIVWLAQSLGTRLPPKPDGKALRDFLLKEHQIHHDQFPDLSLAMIKLLGRGEYVLGTPGGGGHFDLALRDYAHTTAPNRRYPDLIMQRILRAHFFSQPAPYPDSELIKIAKRCTDKEEDAVKVERRLIKCAAAMTLEHRVGEQFFGMVTGAGRKGSWVRLDHPRIEGKLMRSDHVDVGDHVKVKLVFIDVRKGHIDFELV